MDNQVDILLDIDNKTINIELNNNSSKDVLERNLVFGCKIHGEQLEYGEKDYTKIGYTHQINLNNFPCNKESIKNTYYLRNENGEIMSKKLKIDYVDIAKASDKSYNGYNEKLARFCRAIITVKRKDLIKELGDIMEKEAKDKLVEKVDTYSKNKKMVKLYSKYTRQELEHNTLIREAELRGINKEKIEIAKKLLADGMDIDKVSKMTDLDIEKIEKLK